MNQPRPCECRSADCLPCFDQMLVNAKFRLIVGEIEEPELRIPFPEVEA